LILQPEIEIPRLFQAINLPYKDTIFTQAGKPSTTTVRFSAIVTGDNKITGWQKFLSPAQIRNILAVVEAFDLDYIYSDSVTPHGERAHCHTVIGGCS